MKTTHTRGDYKVEFNGSETWFITDNNGDTYKTVNTERKAINALNKIAKMAGQ